MSTSASSPKRVFGLLSCVALAGAIMASAASARAELPECAEDDPGALTYAPAKAVPGACSATDLAFLDEAMNDPVAYETFKDVEDALKVKSAACAACVFTKPGAKAPGPILVVGPEPDDYEPNFSACLEKAPGGGANCGADDFKAMACAEVRCGACTEEGDFLACLGEVLFDDTSCGKYDVDVSCADPEEAYEYCEADEEGFFMKTVEAFCGGTAPPDSGSSSGGSSSSSSSSGGSSSGGQSSGWNGPDERPPPPEQPEAESTNSAETTSGCAQGPSSAGGSLASLLVLGVAVGAAVSRRRRAS